MPLPVRPHPDAAPRTRASRVLDGVGTVSENSDPYLEFLSEEPGEPAVRQPVFDVVPVSSEAPSYVAEDRPQDQFLSPRRNVPADVGLFRAFFRTVLVALRRGVVWTLLAPYRVVMGTLLALRRGVVALYRGVTGALLALYRGVTGALLALHRGVTGRLLALYRAVTGRLLALYRAVTGTLLALHRGVTGALLALHRGVTGTLLALHRGVTGALLALYRGVTGRLLALYRGVTGTLLALHRGVMGTLVALCRDMVGALLALCHEIVGPLLALYRGVMGTFLGLRRAVVWVLLALCRGVMGTLLALFRGVTRTPLALCRGVMGALRALDRGMVRALLALDRRMVRALLALERGIEGPLLAALYRGVMGTTLALCRSVIAISRLSGVATELLRAQLTRDIRTIERFMSMVGRRLSVVASSLHERHRVSLRVPIRNARLWMSRPLWALKISRVRDPVTNETVVALTGGVAVGALVMWLLGMQPDQPRLTDRAVAPVAEVVASELSADNNAATVYAAMSRTIPVEQQGTARSPLSGPMAVTSAAMTVTSTPAGARVTVNGIGWGETPVTIHNLPPGQKVVRVTKEGYESQQRIISIPDDRRSANVRVTLLAPR